MVVSELNIGLELENYLFSYSYHKWEMAWCCPRLGFKHSEILVYGILLRTELHFMISPVHEELCVHRFIFFQMSLNFLPLEYVIICILY